MEIKAVCQVCTLPSQRAVASAATANSAE